KHLGQPTRWLILIGKTQPMSGLRLNFYPNSNRWVCRILETSQSLRQPQSSVRFSSLLFFSLKNRTASRMQCVPAIFRKSWSKRKRNADVLIQIFNIVSTPIHRFSQWFLPVSHNGEGSVGYEWVFPYNKSPIHTPPGLPTVRRGEESSAKKKLS